MVTTTIGKVSGGTGSYLAVKRYVEGHGRDGLKLLFTDTLCEDQDAYRFLIAGAADLLGVVLPAGFIPAIEDFPAWEDRENYKAFVIALGAQARAAIPGLNWISDSRDPFDIYESERFLGNSRVDPCSKILKRRLADRWLAEYCVPHETQIIVGIDYEEEHRFVGGPRSLGIRALWAERGWTAIAPLCDKPFLPWNERVEKVKSAGLWLPRLNALGFAHNNCGGFCCKAGQGHWKLMLQTFPERYAYSEQREQQIRSTLGDVSMLTDRRGGDKKPLTLEALRSRELTPDEAADHGACNCFFPEAALSLPT